MSITQKEKLLVETFCDLCGKSQGTSLIDPGEYPAWLKQTADLLVFDVDGKAMFLCWDCIRQRGLMKEYDRRVNEVTYGKPGDK